MLVLDFNIVIFCIYKQTFLFMSLLPMFRSSHQLKKNNVEFNCMFRYVVLVDFNVIFYILTLVFDENFKS